MLKRYFFIKYAQLEKNKQNVFTIRWNTIINKKKGYPWHIFQYKIIFLK